MSDNRFQCGCELGGDCTKSTMCRVQEAHEDRAQEVADLMQKLDAIERTNQALRDYKNRLEVHCEDLERTIADALAILEHGPFITRTRTAIVILAGADPWMDPTP